ncbi:MAG: signal peptide peptidase SppA [Helicobacter sp.]|nr:signal peptide peptidase SppA [Helicobacter sp.]
MGLFRAIPRFVSFINTNFKTVLLLIALLFVFIGLYAPDGKEPNLAKLYLDKPIFNSTLVASQIEAIKKIDTIQGVLLVIDSPGGSVSASIEAADMIKELAQYIPVVAYVRGSMASGSYYAGMYADEIIANRGSMIGSIGVILSAFNIEELLANLGIKEQVLKMGKYKEIGTIMRAWNENEREFLSNFLHEQYEMFVNDVKLARKDKLHTDPIHFAEGKIFNAKTALELGLIDKVGSMQEAIESLKEKAQVQNPIWLEKDRIDVYLQRLEDSLISKIVSFAFLYNR